ncbi:hypothetical protein [Allocoleopsis franciscana]|uniref:Uncharacterized protein n=1 Tax=Allocoleopsis franciscana PCC 7113 TaxID=1173027 RepID=K9WKM2_9CYAN|nr:hypothetical protein [Allocoleopsis franciscana]AFZ20960.1 hypothetical protein Mic7113_5311 [Allocoleopsis franciscana PCC 7113]
MQRTVAPLSQSKSQYSFEMSDNIYQQLGSLSSTTISLQYGPTSFLTFKVYEASEGMIQRQGGEAIALQCLIRGTVYKLTHEHLYQLSNRELSELLNHLGIQDKHFNLD